MKTFPLFLTVALALTSWSVTAKTTETVYDLGKPSAVTWSGKLELAEKSVPPSNGKNSAQDQKETICVLNLKTAAMLKPTRRSESDPDQFERTQIQLILGENENVCKKLSGETVTVQGILSQAETEHHHTIGILTAKTLTRLWIEKITLQPSQTPFTARYTLKTDIADGMETMQQIEILDQAGKVLHTTRPGFYLLQNSHLTQSSQAADSLLYTENTDANLDGLEDLVYQSDQGITLGSCYDYGLFDPQTQSLIFKKAWKRLCNTTYDTEQKTLTTTEQYGIGSVEEEIIKTYKISGQNLILQSQEHIKE